MDPTLDLSSSQTLYGLEHVRPSYRLGISQVIADADEFDRTRQRTHSEALTAVRQPPLEPRLEAQRQHEQYVGLLETGEPGFSLLMYIGSQPSGIDEQNLTKSLPLEGADIDTLRRLSKARLLAIDGNSVVLTELGANIVMRLADLEK